MGAECCGHAPQGADGPLGEAREHPDWKWEVERRQAIRDRVEATRPVPSRRSVVPVTAEWRRNLDQMRHGIAGDN
jgi:hypothetical protein